MAEDLGTNLLRAGLVTRGQLAEVRTTAPLHDGALVQALAEHGLSEDALVGFFVAQGFGPLLNAADLAQAQAQARSRISARMAHELLALPVRESPAGLIVAMAAPTDPHATAELARVVGIVLPAVSRASELRAALNQFYPDTETSPPPPPTEPVLELTVRRKDPQAGPYQGSTRGAERVEARATLGPRLVADEGETFVPLVRQKAAPSAAPGGPERVVTARFERPPELLTSSAPPAQKKQPASIIPPEHESWDTPSSAPNPLNKVDRNRLSANPLDAQKRLPGVGEQIAAIRRSQNRDEVAELACRAAATVARSAVLLAMRKDVLRGWDGWGAALSRDAVRNLWVPTKSPSVFREVLQTKLSHRGPPGHTAADALFRAAVGSRGGEMVVCPVVVGGRAVAVLAADDVRYGDSGVERIETLARTVGEAFERLIVEAKK